MGKLGEYLRDLGDVIITRFNPFGCVYTTRGLPYHDHRKGGVKPPVVQLGSRFVPYDATIHGEVKQKSFIDEGQRVTELPTAVYGAEPTHRHVGTTLYGPYEFNWE